MKRYSYTIFGRVQGVFFRASTQEMAEKLALTGFVMNQKDSTVYCEVQGPETDLKLMEEWLHKGSKNALVENVVRKEVALEDSLIFEIKR